MATQIIATIESSYRPTPDSFIEYSSNTYRFEAGMFTNSQWSKIVAARGTTCDCHRLPQSLQNLFEDILANGNILEEIEDAKPEVTFVLEFGEPVEHPEEHSKARHAAVDKILVYLGREPFDEDI